MHRWKQRLESYKKAFKQFENGVILYKSKELSDLEKQGIIQSFEYCFELGWNLMKDYLNYQGIYDIRGPRDAIKLAFKYDIVDDADVWIEMISVRNMTTHTYDPDILKDVLEEIINTFYPSLKQLLDRFISIEERESI